MKNKKSTSQKSTNNMPLSKLDKKLNKTRQKISKLKKHSLKRNLRKKSMLLCKNASFLSNHKNSTSKSDTKDESNLLPDLDDDIFDNMGSSDTKSSLPDLDDDIFDSMEDSDSLPDLEDNIFNGMEDTDNESDVSDGMLLPDLDESIFQNVSKDNGQNSQCNNSNSASSDREDMLPDLEDSVFSNFSSNEDKTSWENMDLSRSDVSKDNEDTTIKKEKLNNRGNISQDNPEITDPDSKIKIEKVNKAHLNDEESVDDPNPVNPPKLLDKTKNKPNVKPFERNKRTLPSSVPRQVSLAFTNLERTLITPINFKHNVKLLVNVLTDKVNVSESKDIIFYVLQYLSHLNKNLILDYRKTRDLSKLQLKYEDCLVAALIEINSHPDFKNYLLMLVINIRQFILSLDAIHLQGLCALCRMHTKMCKENENRKESLLLCSEILKLDHKFGPMLIASIVIEWKELFEITANAHEEDAVFYGSLALAARRWKEPTATRHAKIGLKYHEYEVSKSLIEKFMSISPLNPTRKIIDSLFSNLKAKCLYEKSDEEYKTTAPIVIYSAFKGYSWAKNYIVEKHLRPCIDRCVDNCKSPKGLTMLCKLYAEIMYLYPDLNEAEDFLFTLFENQDEKTKVFVQSSSAMALIQLYLLKNLPLPSKLQKWIDDNESDPKLIHLKLLRHRSNLTNKLHFTKEDIMI